MTEGYRVPARPLTGEQAMALLREYATAAGQHGAQSTYALAIRNRIVEGNVGLVFTVWKAHGRRLQHVDVLGIGSLGLITAVERFDVARGVRFSTYAMPWIRHALGRTQANEGLTFVSQSMPNAARPRGPSFAMRLRPPAAYARWTYS